MKDPTGRDADNIAFGTTLSRDVHAARSFDYLIANPPYGKDWTRDENAVRAEHERGVAGRFSPGLPRISDGQLLFLLNMLAHAKDTAQGGSRIAIVMNGSPPFTGDAGSGESEIRRFIFENDLLEALIALPEQLFYNTGIATYVWVLTNCKAEGIRKLLADYRDGDTRAVTKDGDSEKAVVSLIFPTTHFGFRKVTAERPLGINFQASPELAARLDEEWSFQLLIKSKKRGYAAAQEEAQSRRLQEMLRNLVKGLPDTLLIDRDAFESMLDAAAKEAGLKLPAPARKSILTALSERDQTAAICRRRDGKPELDPELRDTERVPLTESVDAFFEREAVPNVPDAWIDESKRDAKDGEVGAVGYEINFNRYFYRYAPPRPLEDIESDIRGIEADIVRMLGEVTASDSR